MRTICSSRYEFAAYPEDLRRSVRIILGLMHAGILDFDLIGRAVGWTNQEGARAQARWRTILRSQSHLVADILERGLPLSALADLDFGVTYYCPKCGGRRQSVPCFLCPAPWVPRDDDEEDVPLTEPAFPTQAIPGSREKVELMAVRVALGQSPFHPQDRRDEVGYAKGSKLDIVSIGRLEREWDYRDE